MWFAKTKKKKEKEANHSQKKKRKEEEANVDYGSIITESCLLFSIMA